MHLLACWNGEVSGSSTQGHSLQEQQLMGVISTSVLSSSPPLPTGMPSACSTGVQSFSTQPAYFSWLPCCQILASTCLSHEGQTGEEHWCRAEGRFWDPDMPSRHIDCGSVASTSMSVSFLSWISVFVQLKRILCRWHYSVSREDVQSCRLKVFRQWRGMFKYAEEYLSRQDRLILEQWLHILWPWHGHMVSCLFLYSW